jgi:hypothetical protein
MRVAEDRARWRAIGEAGPAGPTVDCGELMMMMMINVMNELIAFYLSIILYKIKNFNVSGLVSIAYANQS